MSIQENVQIVKGGYAAFGRGDIQGLIAMFAEDVEWITPGEGLPWAGTYRGHAAVADLFQKVSQMVEFSEPGLPYHGAFFFRTNQQGSC